MFYGDKYANSAEEIANLFAEFFSANFVCDSDIDRSYSDFSDSSLSIGTLSVTEDDVQEAIANLKPSSITDADGLAPILLKNCFSLTKPLMLIFNKSLSAGLFLEDWKRAHITPIFKSGNKNDVTNYRPITKLTTISKLFEIVVRKKLIFAVSSLISPNQHGFMSGRSTVSNLAIFHEDCIDNFKAGYQVDAIYTDFSKAFDRVSHKILLSKLAYLGFHSTFLTWIASYLSGRTCSVGLENITSHPFLVSSGVPQGSILGPLFFIIFINDISSCFCYSKFLLYADDLKIYSTISNAEDSVLLQSDLDRVYSWCEKNRLYLNIDKCFQVVYSRRANTIYNTYHISGSKLKTVDLIKDLGVYFDSKLTFSNHIDYLIPNAYAMLGFVRRNCTHFSDPYTLKKLYIAFVRARLEYAAFIWRPFQATYIKRIERIQKVFIKFALRPLNFSEPLPSYDSRCQLLNLTSLHSRRTLLSCSFVLNVLAHEIDCSDILRRIPLNIPVRNLRHFDMFHVQLNKSNYAMNAPIARTLSELNNVKDIDLSFTGAVLKNLVLSHFQTHRS